MQVPCCGGLIQMVKAAAAKAERKVPVKQIIVLLFRAFPIDQSQ